MTTKTIYTLVFRDGNWQRDFSDYDIERVKSEERSVRADLLSQGVPTKTQIISSGDTDEEIEEAIEKLNYG